jgi:type I restriction enzyme S subunit
MGGEWQEYMVRELQEIGQLLVEDGNHGEYRPRRDEFCKEGTAFIRASDMDCGRVLFDSASKINGTAVARIRKGIGVGGDVLLSHKGTVGKLAMVPLDAPPFVCSPQTTFWRSLNPDAIDRRYLYAYMHSPHFRQQLDSRKGETDMADYVSLTAQREFRVLLPPIADRANAEGRDTGLPGEIADLFPDSFEDSELGAVPEGWEVKEIKECCKKVQNGGTPKRSEPDYWNPRTIPWLTSGEVRQTLIPTTENAISELGLKKSSAKWLPKDSTVVALYGATAGQVALISSKMTTNQAVCGLIPRANYRFFNYLFLDRSVGALANLARGSAQQNISKGIVETTKMGVPSVYILESFDRMVSPVFDKWVANLEESTILAALRDTLLPKLLSGGLRIPDVETFMEGTSV